MTHTYSFSFGSPYILLLSLLVALVGSLFPFVFYGKGIELLGSVKASLFVTVEPVTSAILTWMCFGTRFTKEDIIGFLLILGAIEGVSVMTFKMKKKD